ncbi:MAG: hypothetical protein K6E13_08020 [Lachnospiraceae bacterium]|nr:hypothetical protein [Lachnospiraceae bacterium]
MSKIIAVDFDGTICEDRFPECGFPNLSLIKELIRQRSEGDKLILWTCRTGRDLEAAVSFCRFHHLEFDAVNCNLPQTIERYGSDSRKIFADVYIDDKAWQPRWHDIQEEENYERKEKYA